MRFVIWKNKDFAEPYTAEMFGWSIKALEHVLSSKEIEEYIAKLGQKYIDELSLEELQKLSPEMWEKLEEYVENADILIDEHGYSYIRFPNQVYFDHYWTEQNLEFKNYIDENHPIQEF